MNHKGQLKEEKKGLMHFFHREIFGLLVIKGNLARNTGALAGLISRKRILCVKFLDPVSCSKQCKMSTPRVWATLFSQILSYSNEQPVLFQGEEEVARESHSLSSLVGLGCSSRAPQGN